MQCDGAFAQLVAERGTIATIILDMGGGETKYKVNAYKKC